jgi:hypothetical protein
VEHSKGKGGERTMATSRFQGGSSWLAVLIKDHAVLSPVRKFRIVLIVCQILWGT